MRKILLFGGAGYIGSHVALELIDKNYEVIIFDNLSVGKKEYIPKQAKLYVGDITSDTDLENVFKNEKVDCVMDFAAKIIVPESMTQPLEYFYNNFEGVRKIISKMVKYNVKNIVFSSTAAVYGEPKNGVCTETDILNPINPYGESKLSAEKLIKWSSQAYNINYMIFRYFNVAGADEKMRSGLVSKKLTHIVPIITETMLKKRDALTIFGNDFDTKDGTCIRDYVHVSDLANAHVLGAEYIMNNNKSEIINLGSNVGYSVKELVDTALKIIPFKYSVGKRREGDPAILIAKNEKAKEILNWQPTKSLYDIIYSDYKFRGTLK